MKAPLLALVVLAGIGVLVAVACGDAPIGTGSSGSSSGSSTSSSGSSNGDPSGDKQPACGFMCSGNYLCATESVAACPNVLTGFHCQTDADCSDAGTGSYCHTCESGKRFCSAGCDTYPSCSQWEHCVANRCLPLACATDADCPPNFACGESDGGPKACVRRSCLTDANCAGYCVQHECQSKLGACACFGC